MRILILLVVGLSVIGGSFGNDLQAQEVKQTLRDYFGDRPLTYAPTDPWVRSHTFNQHVGRTGVYFNCDGEEEKRNSPYICWKSHFEADFPERKGLGAQIKQDWARMRQRICDGAGDCCSGCQSKTPCQCAECTGGAPVAQEGFQQEVIVEAQACQCAKCAAQRAGGAFSAHKTKVLTRGELVQQASVAKQINSSQPSLLGRLKNPGVASAAQVLSKPANVGVATQARRINTTAQSVAACNCKECQKLRQKLRQNRPLGKTTRVADEAKRFGSTRIR